MKAVMPPSASLRMSAVAAEFHANHASAQRAVSLPKLSAPSPELSCNVHANRLGKPPATCTIHSSVSWGMATFTLEAF